MKIFQKEIKRFFESHGPTERGALGGYGGLPLVSNTQELKENRKGDNSFDKLSINKLRARKKMQNLSVPRSGTVFSLAYIFLKITLF